MNLIERLRKAACFGGHYAEAADLIESQQEEISRLKKFTCRYMATNSICATTCVVEENARLKRQIVDVASYESAALRKENTRLREEMLRAADRANDPALDAEYVRRYVQTSFPALIRALDDALAEREG